LVVPTARSDFHVYAIEWTPEEIRGYVDDAHFFTFPNERRTDPAATHMEWPFDQPFHLVMNVAVGGNWGGARGVDPDIWPQRMEVEYVRVYERDE
ncbi:MAG TPA: glycoside hydrolase family 16 protein, partial [Longimicrobiales bacterium]|nr:glycoside hydrolase family 16 protein [Longimicrobiales bacterium]